jgi:hypothetical protein
MLLFNWSMSPYLDVSLLVLFHKPTTARGSTRTHELRTTTLGGTCTLFVTRAGVITYFDPSLPLSELELSRVDILIQSPVSTSVRALLLDLKYRQPKYPMAVKVGRMTTGKPMHRRSCTSMCTPIAGAVFVPADMFVFADGEVECGCRVLETVPTVCVKFASHKGQWDL